jgi:hypothetical protein
MTRGMADLARLGAIVAALAAGAHVVGAMPTTEDPLSRAAIDRLACQSDATLAEFSTLHLGQAESARIGRERRARCAPEPPKGWDAPLLQRGAILAGVAVALLLAGAMLASMARREALAEDMLREARRRHD